jgi:hypothetical protein
LDELNVALPSAAEASYEAATTNLDGTRAILDDQIDAATEVQEAVDAEAAGRGFIASVGLYGEKLGPLLDDARAALASGDTDRALDDARTVMTRLDRSDDIGRARVVKTVVAIVAVLALVLLVIILVVRRNKRRNKRRTLEPAGDTL